MLAIRLAVTVGLLVVLVPRIHLGSIDWGASAAAWLAAGLVATFAGIVLSALRWQRVILALGQTEPLRRLVDHYFAGQFVANFLPSTVGGDVLRTARLSADTGDGHTAFASVVLERLTGWLVLPAITLVGFGINRGLFRVARADARLAMLLAVCTLVLLAALLFLAAHPRLGGRLAGHHQAWLRWLGAVHVGLDRMRRDRRAVVSIVVAGFAYQLVVVLSAFLAGRAMGVDVSFTVFLAFFPVVAIAQVLPISIGGIGLREGALVIFLDHWATHTQAVTLGLAFYGMNLIVSLLGAPSFALGHRPRSSDRVVA
jgi:uncharacterized protein (TIRG00374 family)